MCRCPDQVSKCAGIKKSWIGLPCFGSIAGKLCIGRDGDFFPDLGTETEIFRDLTRIVCELRGAGRAIEGMVNADGTKKRKAISSYPAYSASVSWLNRLFGYVLLVNQPLPAFISPGTRAESNVAEVEGHGKMIIQNLSLRTIG